MKLDRNINRGGRGKYALVNMRKIIPLMDELTEANRTTNPDKLPNNKELEILAAFDLLVKEGIITLGNETPGDQFFVMKYKDKFTAPGLQGYAHGAMAEANAQNSKSLHEYAMQMFQEAKAAQLLGNRIPD